MGLNNGRSHWDGPCAIATGLFWSLTYPIWVLPAYCKENGKWWYPTSAWFYNSDSFTEKFLLDYTPDEVKVNSMYKRYIPPPDATIDSETMDSEEDPDAGTPTPPSKGWSTWTIISLI